MRIIGSLHNQKDTVQFSYFLQQKGILHEVEVLKNTDWGSAEYGAEECQFWIKDEDQVEEALKWLHLFTNDPQNSIFHSSSPILTSASNEPQQSPQPTSSVYSTEPVATNWSKQALGWVTRSLLLICCILFISGQFLHSPVHIPARFSGLLLFTSPVDRVLLYDYPKLYQLIARFLHQYSYEELESPSDLPPEGRELLQQINQTPFWPGFYHLFLKGGVDAAIKGFNEYPTFEKIKEGEVWRLFTPCLLHGDLFHIFFNMLWLIVLGKQIEQRLTSWRYILFILILGIISNTAQYLVSGPNFIGFSGILCGMLVFIWVRQRNAAWEGYQMDRLTLMFMLIFVLSMLTLQVFSFVMEKSFDWAFSLNIANMAHITGGLVGWLLGKVNFFSWRHT